MRTVDRAVPVVSGSHPPLASGWPADLTIAIEGVALEGNAWDDFEAVWDDPGDLYLWDDPVSTTASHVDATCDVQGLDIETGTPDPEGRFESGHLVLTLNNTSGEWSHYDKFGRLVNWPIGRALDVWATFEGETFWLFGGHITAWKETAFATVEVEAFDVFSRLNAHLGSWQAGVRGDQPYQRLEAICTLINFTGPHRFDLGEVTLRAKNTERSVLEEMKQVALSDGGVLLCDADGTLVYRDRTWPAGRTDQLSTPVFTDNVCTGPMVVWDPVLSTDDEAMVNIAHLENDDPPVKVVEARNQDSINLYGPLTLAETRVEDQWMEAAEGQALADFIVSRRGDALIRLESFTLWLHDPNQNLWRAGIDLRLGDIVEFVHDQPAIGGAALVDLFLAVAYIHHEITPQAWVTTVATTRAVANRITERWDYTQYAWDGTEPENTWGY